MADVFGDSPLRLERDARQELVAELSGQGMSTRAIAPILGVSQKTIDRDVRESFDSPAPEPHRVVEVITADADTGEVIEPRKITGMDGKEYAVPIQKKPNRRALTEVARDTGWDIRKAVEKLERAR